MTFFVDVGAATIVGNCAAGSATGDNTVVSSDNDSSGIGIYDDLPVNISDGGIITDFAAAGSIGAGADTNAGIGIAVGLAADFDGAGVCVTADCDGIAVDLAAERDGSVADCDGIAVDGAVDDAGAVGCNGTFVIPCGVIFHDILSAL